jgi:HPt (histidine-containing phosphotransfer) domain-containing protein
MTSEFHPDDNPIVNLELALERLDHDRGLLRDLAGFYLEDAPQLCNQVEAGLATENVEEIVRGAHSLKGLSANFDATIAASAALDVELSGRQGDIEAARQAFPRLKAEVQRVIEFLELNVLTPSASRHPR